MNSAKYVVLPGLMSEARNSAEFLRLNTNLLAAPMAEREGMWVTRKGKRDESQVLFELEHEGEQFIVFQKEEK